MKNYAYQLIINQIPNLTTLDDLITQLQSNVAIAEITNRSIRICKHFARKDDASIEFLCSKYGNGRNNFYLSAFREAEYLYIDQRGKTREEIRALNLSEWNDFWSLKKRVAIIAEDAVSCLPPASPKDGVRFDSFPCDSKRFGCERSC